MKKTMAVWVLSCVSPSSVLAGPGEAKKPVPLYTNEDLERVAPFRDQTGVTSRPAVQSAPPPSEARPRAKGEDHWRRAAERLQDRVEPLRERAEELRLKIQERQRKPGVLPYSDRQIQAWQRRLQRIESRIRLWESRLEERARREGALPGWLR